MRKAILIISTVILSLFSINAQIVTPIKWKSSIKVNDDQTGTITFNASIDKGWHLYALTLPDAGIEPTKVNYETLKGVALVGKLTPSRAPHKEMDAMFEAELSWWTENITLSQKFKLTGKDGYLIKGSIRYMACNNITCQSPTNEPFSFNGGRIKEDSAKAQADSTMAAVTVAGTDKDSINAENSSQAQLWAPVNTNLNGNDIETTQNHSLWYIFFAGFLGGLIALLTPCVWPMIPLTVSFFLKKNGSRASSIRDAIIYGASIILIYLLLGMLITVLFGASSLNALSTNALFNIIFFLLLVVFAISFFGAFDIKLPTSWSSRMDNNAERTTGMLSIFFMAFTLTLVSFSCTGPIIGTLLVEAASLGNYVGPVIGMSGFALALAIPFTLFAIFPSLLKEMPKSGGWLNSVKVVLGFIELALSLKFLSVADLAYGWKILDREVFVALWIVIFALLGIYLLGKIRFSHDSETKSIGVFRFFLALISLSFSVYLLPGLWGAPLKSVSAFVPPLYTQDFNLYGGGFEEYNSYDDGMEKAAELNKPILLDFSGFGCVNCRKMEAAVMDNSKVRELLESNFTMIKLMVDDKAKLPTPEVINENGKDITLLTYGDRWSYLQRYKFGANSQPYYVVLNAKGELLSGPYYYDEDVNKFIQFLEKGIKAFNASR